MPDSIEPAWPSPAGWLHAIREILSGSTTTAGYCKRCRASYHCGACPCCLIDSPYTWRATECPGCHDTYVDLDEHLRENVKGCGDVVGECDWCDAETGTLCVVCSAPVCEQHASQWSDGRCVCPDCGP